MLIYVQFRHLFRENRQFFVHLSQGETSQTGYNQRAAAAGRDFRVVFIKHSPEITI
jgi:hypothetical protein